MSEMKTKIILITSVLIIQATLVSYGQNHCSKKDIYGAWKAIGSVGGYQNVISNVDSLKKIIHVDSDPGVFEFQMNGTYTFSNPTIHSKRPYFKKDVYTFDEKTCQLILGTKKKAYRKSNLEILYVDGEYMIITSDNNPHGDYTALYSKQ